MYHILYKTPSSLSLSKALSLTERECIISYTKPLPHFLSLKLYLSLKENVSYLIQNPFLTFSLLALSLTGRGCIISYTKPLPYFLSLKLYPSLKEDVSYLIQNPFLTFSLLSSIPHWKRMYHILYKTPSSLSLS